MNKTSVVVGSSLSAIGSSLVATATAFCCIGPAVIAVIGTSGALAAARLAPFRLYFITGSVLLLGMGFWMAYRPQGGCIGKVCATPSVKVTRALLWIAALIAAVAILLPNFARG